MIFTKKLTVKFKLSLNRIKKRSITSMRNLLFSKAVGPPGPRIIYNNVIISYLKNRQTKNHIKINIKCLTLNYFLFNTD